jgi:hypothetical protein
MRNKYESWDDCVPTTRPAKCKREEESTTGGVRRYYYYGPWFAASRFRNSTYNPGFSGGRSIVSVWRAADSGLPDVRPFRRGVPVRRITLDRMREDWQSKVEGLGFYFHEMTDFRTGIIAFLPVHQ